MFVQLYIFLILIFEYFLFIIIDIMLFLMYLYNVLYMYIKIGNAKVLRNFFNAFLMFVIVPFFYI